MSALLDRLDAASWDTLNQAVRAVLERHRDDGTGHCSACFTELGSWDDHALFPCATVLDVTEVLAK